MSPYTDRTATHYAPGSKEGAIVFRPAMIWVAFCTWWKLIVPCGLLLAAGAGAFIYSGFTPVYEASAVLMIHERKLGVIDSPDFSPRFVENQIELLRSAPVLDPVVSDPEIAKLPEFAHVMDPKSALQRGLYIRNVGRSEMFAVGFVCQDAQGAALVANRVAKSYLRVQSSDQKRRAEEVIGYLQREKTSRAVEMQRLRENVRTLAKQITGKDPLAVAASKTVDAGSSVADLQVQLARLDVSQSIDQERITNLQTKIEEKRSIAVSDTEVDTRIAADPRIQNAINQVVQMRGRILEYEKTSANPKSVPNYVRLLADVKRADEEIQSLRKELRTGVIEAIQQERMVELQQELTDLSKKLEADAVTHRVYKKKLQSELDNARQFTGDTLELDFVRQELEQATSIHNQVSSSLMLLQTGKGEPERVYLWQEAQVPLSPRELVPWKKIALASLAGLIAPLALAVLWDMRAKRVADREHIENTMHLRVLGEVARLPSNVTDTHSTQVMVFEESIDSLRTNILLSESLVGVKVLAVVSASSREGKTSLASQLAVSVARATGRPTLLIDGDMRAPDIDNIFEVRSEPGLAEALKGSCSASEAVVLNGVDNLYIMPAGKLKSSPHKLTGRGRFEKLIDELRAQYDYIVIDTPPVLAAGESLIMASVADAVIVAAMHNRSRVHQVRHVVQLLMSAGAKTAGIVLNGVPLRSYSYHYGSYNYAKRYARDSQEDVEEEISSH